MGWMDALSFATETLTTVGYGDFNFLGQPLWLRLWGVVMMLSGIALITVTVAFVADVLLSRRLPQAASRQQIKHLQQHFVIVGLGSFGIRVAGLLKDAGHPVAVIERDEYNRYLSAATEQHIPVIIGDATLRTTLAAARVEHARAIAVLTEHDMVNIETGLVLREMTGGTGESRTPIVLRIYDKAVGAAVGPLARFQPRPIHRRSGDAVVHRGGDGLGGAGHLLGWSAARSWWAGSRWQPGSALDGIRMIDLSTKTRVIALQRAGTTATLHPHADEWLQAGDTAYLVGPYHELLDTAQDVATQASRRASRRLVMPQHPQGIVLEDQRQHVRVDVESVEVRAASDPG